MRLIQDVINYNWGNGDFFFLRILSMDLVFGAHTIEGNEETQVKETSDEFIIHPGYDKGQLINDIALVKLRAPAPETEYIKVVKVASGAETYAGREGTLRFSSPRL